jgi:alanyl-tRNA synthetase
MDIREEFLNFFEKRGHLRIESSPLVPDDSTLLFSNSGMVQFKKIFTGELPVPQNKRATTAQTCLRAGGKHNDLENVGYTARHHTFFEMLGNFSFGDYFKRDAIKYGWEFVTTILKLDKTRLYITVHNSDDEAFEMWQEHISADRIKRMGDKDNFWQMGDTGPCGPSSEIFYDQGADKFNSSEDYFGGDGDRFLEIWNLVFMQYNRESDGTLTPLPKPSIDTGMGLERVTAIREGEISNFHSSLFKPILNKISEIVGIEYNKNSKNSGSYRVIADHIRAVTFLLAQGVRFDREGRGYVLRRILRRAVRHGYLLALREPFMYKLVDTLIEILGKNYKYLITESERIKSEIEREEARFFQTISGGIEIFEDELTRSEKIFSGDIAFKLYDTFGFPLDLTADMLRERNMSVDVERFEILMNEQRTRAKANWQGSGDQSQDGDFRKTLEEFGENKFIYNNLSLNVEIIALFDENFKRVESANHGWLYLKETPFYAESGGQCGDSGTIGNVEILDTKKFSGLNLSKFKGLLKVGEKLNAQVSQNRSEIAKHHSATHLLHSVLKEILGSNVSQAGSSVDKNRLRFDFSFDRQVSRNELREIESQVNRYISRGIAGKTEILPINEARTRGATALFGEKYGDTVRVVSFENASIEFCGGTHVSNSSEISLFLIVKESGVSSGVRRIEAVVSESAEKFVRELRDEREIAIEKMKSQNLIGGIEKLQKQIIELKAEMKRNVSKKELEIKEYKNQKYIVEILENGDAKEQIDEVKNRFNSIAIMLFTVSDDKIYIFAGTKNTKINSGDWVKNVAKILGGNGGGRPDFAQAGGKDISKLNEAISFSNKYIEEKI